MNKINRSSNDPVVLVTGASRGLGAAVARLASQLGAAVALTARSSADLDAVAEDIQRIGGQSVAIPGDLRALGECRRIIVETVAHFGRLDALVNNAGVLAPVAPIAEVDLRSWEHNLYVNLVAPAALIRAALPHLKERKGRIINVSSGAAIKVTPGWSAYSAAKAGLNMFTRYLAEEVPEVTSIAVRPGIIDTEMQAFIREFGAEGMREEDHQRFIKYHNKEQLLPPQAPGRAIAVLALYADSAWSGEFMEWDDERIHDLIAAHNGSHIPE